MRRPAEPDSADATDTQGSSAFTRNIAALLERTEYRRCNTGEDMEAVYRLRYKAYKARNLVGETTTNMIADALDEAPNCYRFGIFVEGRLISTLRLHRMSAEEPFGPVMRVFDDVLMPRLEAGQTFINPSQLTADPEWNATLRAVPYLTLRLAVIANVYFSSTNCVCMIRDEHTAFYRRVFGSVQVGDPRPYPPFTPPVMLYDCDCFKNNDMIFRRFPFFRATATEQRLLFAKPKRGELAPLTILPSLRFIKAAA